MNLIPVYFMPGLAASSSIFEQIKLPNTQFESFFLDWVIPLENENLSEYAKRMSEQIIHKNPVLIGVSFGGILVQEMAQFIHLRKLIIVSSVKTNNEFPQRMKLAKKTKAYKLLPTSWISNLDKLAKYAFGNMMKGRLDLYKKYLTITEKTYFDWAIEQIILWDRTEIDPNVVHIHGNEDNVFPVKNIKDFILVEGGTHIMIINRHKWFNQNLPQIILE